jgi:hypothetical protein
MLYPIAVAQTTWFRLSERSQEFPEARFHAGLSARTSGPRHEPGFAAAKNFKKAQQNRTSVIPAQGSVDLVEP